MKKLFTGLPALALLAIETFKSAGQSASSEAAATSPETMLVGVATNVMGTVLGEVLGGQADKHFNQWLEGSYTDEIGVNADVEKCSRDAALKALLFLVKKASEHTDLNDTEKHHLSHLFKGARKKLKEIESLPENDPVLAQNPLTELGEISRILNGSASVKEAQLNEHLVRYVLRLAGLNHETNLLYPRVRDWLQNGLPVRDSPQRVHWFAAYCLAFADNLKSGGNKPAYCQRAREALVNTQLAGVSVRMERIDAFAAALPGLEAAMRQVTDGLERVETRLQQLYDGLFLKQPFTSVETLVASNALGENPTSEVLSDNLLQVVGFRSRQVTFVGREAEQAALRAFLDENAELRWWGVVGPGGMGKSRLALELAYEKHTADGWAAGFVENHQLEHFDWEHWQPLAPTLLLVDYAGTKPEPLRQALRRIAARQATLPFAVRVLLLERAEKRPEDWWEPLANDPALLRTRHQPNPLPLNPLTDDQLGRILTAVLAQYGKAPTNLPALLKVLANIDPQRRPLFAVFLAVVVAQRNPTFGELLAADDVLEALYNLLLGQWQKASPGGIPGTYLNLQALATLCYGLTQEQWEKLQNLPHGLFPTDWNEALVNTLCQPYSDQLVVNPLQPDIFGEYVVLRRLRRLTETSGPARKGKQLAATAWQIAPSNTALVIGRMAKDLPHLLERQQYVYDNTTLPTTENKEPALSHWAGLVVDLTYHNFSGSIATLDRLCQLAEPTDEIRLRQATALYNLVTHLCEDEQFDEAEKFDKAEKWLGRLLQMAEPTDEIRLRQAKALYNLVTALGKDQKLDKAEKHYETLRQLAEQHPTDEIRLEQAMALNNLVAHLCEDQKLDKAEKHYETLRQLAEQHPTDEIRLRQAMALNNLVAHLCEDQKLDKAEKFDKAEKWLGRLLQMAEPTDEIRLEQAKALYNLVTALGKDQKFDKAEKWLGRLLQMAEPTDEIRLEQATATNNLIQCYIKAKNWQRAEQIYVEHLMPLATRIETAEYGWPFAAAAYRLLTHPVYIDYAQQPDRFPEHGENITAVFQQRVSFLSGLINQFGENPDWQQLIEITRGDKTFQECLRFYFPPPPAG